MICSRLNKQSSKKNKHKIDRFFSDQQQSILIVIFKANSPLMTTFSSGAVLDISTEFFRSFYCWPTVCAFVCVQWKPLLHTRIYNLIIRNLLQIKWTLRIRKPGCIEHFCSRSNVCIAHHHRMVRMGQQKEPRQQQQQQQKQIEFRVCAYTVMTHSFIMLTAAINSHSYPLHIHGVRKKLLENAHAYFG